jgi:hypothetical protein
MNIALALAPFALLAAAILWVGEKQCAFVGALAVCGGAYLWMLAGLGWAFLLDRWQARRVWPGWASWVIVPTSVIGWFVALNWWASAAGAQFRCYFYE